MKKSKIFTEKQLERLPKLGYWLETFSIENPNLYSIQNGRCFYVNWSIIEEGWIVLLWTCCPTKYMVLNSNFEYFETIEELEIEHPNLNKIYFTKAPNDL